MSSSRTPTQCANSSTPSSAKRLPTTRSTERSWTRYLVAGRLKDNELIAALIHYKLVDVETLRARLAAVTDLHMRAIWFARLQIVLENVD